MNAGLQCLQLVLTNELPGCHDTRTTDPCVTEGSTTFPDDLIFPVFVDYTHARDTRGIVVRDDGVVHVFGFVFDLANSERFLLERFNPLLQHFEELLIGVFAH